MKTAPFNIEEAKAGKPVVTRGGKKWKFLAVNMDADKDLQLVGTIFNNGNPMAWGIDGVYVEGKEESADLFMLVEEKTWWYALVRDNEGYMFTTAVYSSEQNLDDHVKHFRYTVLQKHSYTE